MLPVLDLDPTIGPAAAIAALAMLGDHTLQPHQAGVPEQVRADLALLEVGQEYAVDAARQQSGEAGLAHVERQSAEILAIADEDVEGVELHLGVMLAAVQAVEVRPAIDACARSANAATCCTIGRTIWRSAGSLTAGARQSAISSSARTRQ